MTDTRYHRHNLIDWFSQDALAKTKVAVIGAGAVGNEVIKNLALLGVGEIYVFDLDVIEEHNLTRSVLFRDADIGQSKAAVAAKRAMELDRNVSAVAVHGDFWSELTLSHLRSFDVVICCVDNFEARIRSNLLCYLAGVDFVNTGIDSRSASIELYPFSRSRQIGCLECNLPGSVYRRIAERYSCGHLRKVSFIERKIPTTIVTSTAVASLAVSLGLRLGASTRPRRDRTSFQNRAFKAISKRRSRHHPAHNRFAVALSVDGTDRDHQDADPASKRLRLRPDMSRGHLVANAGLGFSC